MIAIIKTGGKQYIVKEGMSLKVEKLEGEKGDKFVFEEVLLVGEEGQEPKIGTPLVAGARVETTIEEQSREKKVTVIKYKAKVRYKRKIGHRQSYTKVKIEKITCKI